MLPRVEENVRELTLTLPSELPFWELGPDGLSNFQKEIA
jgi:hypothetical protein